MAKTQYRNMGKGCEEILPQGKVKKGTSDLQKRQANYFQKRFQIRDLEKVPYSKGSCSKFIFFNQPITYSMFLVSLSAITITEERTHNLTLRRCCRTHVTLFVSGVCRSACPCLLQGCCLLKREPITLCLTDLYFL